MKNEFDVNDLKTGMRVTFKNGQISLVMRGVYNDYSGGTADVVIDPRVNSHAWDRLSTCENSYGKLVKVEVPKHAYDIFYKQDGFRVIWEYREETEQQKQIRELEETINQAKSQIEALKKEI